MSHHDDPHCLLHNDLGEVQVCGCGGISLAMGPMTLHFTPEEVEALFELVYTAKQAVESSGQQRAARKQRAKGKSKAHGTLH